MHWFQGISRGQGLLVGCALAVGLLAAGSCLAEPAAPDTPADPATSALRLSGFGTLGVSQTSAPPGWGFQRESFQAPNDGGTRFDTDSRLGLQANYSIDPRLEIVGQLLMMRRLSSSADSDAVAWAFAAYRPTENLTVRAGRLSINLYQLGDYRSIGLAYPFVRPPTEFYSLLPSAFDGLDVSQSWRDGSDATWKLSGVYGQTKQADNVTRGYRAVRPVFGLFVSREEEGLLVKASVSRVRLVSNTPALAPLVAALEPFASLPVPEVATEAAGLLKSLLPGQIADYFGLGLNFDRDDWLLLVEASEVHLHGTFRVDSGYALLGRRFGSVTPYAAISAVRTRADSPSPVWAASLTPLFGAAGAAQAQGLANAAYGAVTRGPTQQTWSFGMRWDLSEQTALKFQFDRSHIDANGSVLWPNASTEPAKAHVLSATLDFVF